jgi:hypothetical protein
MAQLGQPLALGLVLWAGLSAVAGYALVRAAWRRNLVRCRQACGPLRPRSITP